MRAETTTITARFVVHRATEWAELAQMRYFLKYLTPGWDENDDETDPVANLLYEVKDAAIPQEFDFVHKDYDKVPVTLFGEDGIEISVFDEAHRLPLGAIVDIQISVVGRVEFQ